MSNDRKTLLRCGDGGMWTSSSAARIRSTFLGEEILLPLKKICLSWGNSPKNGGNESVLYFSSYKCYERHMAACTSFVITRLSGILYPATKPACLDYSRVLMTCTTYTDCSFWCKGHLGTQLIVFCSPRLFRKTIFQNDSILFKFHLVFRLQRIAVTQTTITLLSYMGGMFLTDKHLNLLHF